MEKPFSAACERNKVPILEELKKVITSTDRRLLEIGSGSGQHAIFFAPNFPFLEWFPTETAAHLSGLKLALINESIKNLQAPSRVEIGKDEFPKLKFDLIFTANTFHIMEWKECKSLVKMMGHRLRENSRAMIYGPFKYNGQYTSESNEVFDLSLKKNNPARGIRNFEDVNNIMMKNGFELLDDVSMPANNQFLIYKRLKFTK